MGSVALGVSLEDLDNSLRFLWRPRRLLVFDFVWFCHLFVLCTNTRVMYTRAPSLGAMRLQGLLGRLRRLLMRPLGCRFRVVLEASTPNSTHTPLQRFAFFGCFRNVCFPRVFLFDSFICSVNAGTEVIHSECFCT